MTMKRDEQGVSTVLGAVLVFGLFVITLVAIQTQFTPVWQKQRESDLMQGVSRAMGNLKSDLERQVGNQTLVPVSEQVPLKSSEGFALFTEKTLPGTLSFAPAAAGAGLTLSSNQLTIQSQNGVPLYGINEQWTAVSGGSVTGITKIAHLRLRIVDPSGSAGTLTFTLTDTAGNCAGKLILSDSVQGGSDNNVEAAVYGAASPAGAACAATPISLEDWNEKKQLAPPYFYWDAFNSDSQFPAVIAAATYPVTVTFVVSGVTGDYTMAYDSTSGSGNGGTGLVVPNYSSTSSAGTVAVVNKNNRFPSQTYTLEYGALIVDQPDGSGMVQAPQFTVSASATQVSLGWSVPAMAGSPNSVTGAGAGSVSSSPGTRTFLSALAPRVYFSITTTHPALWASYWDGVLKAAGLSGNVAASGAACATGVQYAICTTASTATLQVFGPTTATGSTANDIFLNFQTQVLNIDVKATG